MWPDRRYSAYEPPQVGTWKALVVVWTDQPLGRISDGQLARDLGVDPSTVAKARQRLGIAVHQPHPPIDWTRVFQCRKPDAALARELGVSRETVRKNRVRLGIPKINVGLGVDWDQQPLGEMPDAQVAQLLGVSEEAVKQARIRRGIPGFTQWPDWDRDLLGKMPDSMIARAFGISKAAVGAERKRRGIPRADLLCLTTEGEPANQEEAIIDLHWHKHNVPHEFQVPIGPYVADWVIDTSKVVEYAGIVNHPDHGENYRERLGRKIEFYRQEGWEVLVLYPPDLPLYNTGLIPRFRDRKQCSGCGRLFGSRGGARGGLVRRATTTLCDPCWRSSR